MRMRIPHSATRNFLAVASATLTFAAAFAAPQTKPSPAPAATQPSQGAIKPAKELPAKKKDPTPAELLEVQNRKFQALESFARAMNLLEAMYVEEKAVEGDVLIERAIKGMVSQLDPHTSYLPASQLRDLTTDTTGKFGGIGVILSQANNRLEVVEVIADSPAARAGIQTGDIVYGVDKIVVTPANVEDILNKMRGLPGSTLNLEIMPASEVPKDLDGAKWDLAMAAKKSKVKTLSVTREIIRTSSVTHAKLSDGYAYIKISVFQEDTAEQVDKALRLYEAQNGGKLDGLILDMRNNPGGLLDQAVRVCDLFLDSGIIVSTIGRERSKQEVEYATKRNTHPYMPIVVMVNESSASASEIVAGALQDHNRALVVGSVSFGKGSVQSIIPLPNGGGLKMTIARYYTPKGRSIQARGITPDIPLPPPQKMVGQKLPDDIKVASTDPNSHYKKESDLEGHIEASDLNAPGQGEGFSADVEKWGQTLKADSQLRIAYTYVRSWARFDKK